MAAKKSSMGTLLKRSTTPSAYVTVAAVDNIQGPTQSADIIDVTTLDSLNFYEEVVTGVIRGGEVTADLTFQPDLAGHLALMQDVAARAVRYFQIYFPTVLPKTCSFAAFVTRVQPKASVRDAIRAALTLRVTGVITWA